MQEWKKFAMKSVYSAGWHISFQLTDHGVTPFTKAK